MYQDYQGVYNRQESTNGQQITNKANIIVYRCFIECVSTIKRTNYTVTLHVLAQAGTEGTVVIDIATQCKQN